MVGEEEILFETDTFVMKGFLLQEPPQSPRYHVWIYGKNNFGIEGERLEEIIENLKDFGKWKKFKELKKDLDN